VSHHVRRPRASRSYRPLAAAAVLLGGLVLASAFAGVTIQENALAREIARLNGQISAETTRNASLQAAAAEKKSDNYIIDKAKELGFVWPWEALIAVQRGADAQAKATPMNERPTRIARWIALFVKP
jgi:hypothetical protein